ncbi:MAG TPA: hypothetical protein VFS91_09205 [Nitrobacter sp.]|nr:hypothetical protein [Nitrobacter sp.]
MNVIDSYILRSGMRAENRYILFLIPLQRSASLCRGGVRLRASGCARMIFVAKQAVIGLSGLTLPGSMA